MLQRLSVLILLTGFTLSAFAQGDTTVTSDGTNRLFNGIDEVSLRVNSAGTLELVVAGRLMDGCQAETIVNTQRQGQTWFVDLYRVVPANTPCTRALLPFDVVVDASELLQLDEEAIIPVFLVINDRIYYVNHAQIEPIGNAQAPAPILSEAFRVELTLEKVTFTSLSSRENALGVTLEGTSSDGCVNLVYRAMPAWNKEEVTDVTLYRALDPAMMCLQAITPFSASFVIDGVQNNTHTLRINGGVYEYDGTHPVLLKSPMFVETIETAIAESFPPQLMINVSGTTDGCNFPIQVNVLAIRENVIPLDVFRVIPDMQACTMIANPFTASANVGSLPSGTYTIYAGNTIITTEWQG